MNDRERSIHLSPVQVVASALASITAAVLASFFGVAGTVIGAGVVSAAASVGNAVYSYWIRSTHRAIRETIPSALLHSGTTVRSLEGSGASVGGASSGRVGIGEPAPDAENTNEVPVFDASRDVPPPGSLRPPPLPPPPDAGAAQGRVADVRPGLDALWQSLRRVGTSLRRVGTSLRWRNVAVATAVVFGLSMGTVTAVEALANKPLSGIVGGSVPAGATTSFGGLVSGGQSSKPSPTSPSSPSESTTTTPSTSTTTPNGSSTTTTTPSRTTSPSTTTTAPSSGGFTPGSNGSTPGGTGSSSGG